MSGGCQSIAFPFLLISSLALVVVCMPPALLRIPQSVSAAIPGPHPYTEISSVVRVGQDRQ